MSRHPLEAYDGLHSESARGCYDPVRGDYPVALWTRRMLAQSAGAIAAAREHAPGAVRGIMLCGRPERRPA